MSNENKSYFVIDIELLHPGYKLNIPYIARRAILEDADMIIYQPHEWFSLYRYLKRSGINTWVRKTLHYTILRIKKPGEKISPFERISHSDDKNYGRWRQLAKELETKESVILANKKAVQKVKLSYKAFFIDKAKKVKFAVSPSSNSFELKLIK